MKNKKVLIVVLSIITVLIIGIVVYLLKTKTIKIEFTGNNGKTEKTEKIEDNLKIVENPINQIELEDYECENFSMKIPKGWAVETAGIDMYYVVRVYDKEDSRNQIYISLKAGPFIKSNEARKVWKDYTAVSGNYYNSQMWVDAVILNPATTLNFYQEFNNYAEFIKKYETTCSGFNFPFLSVFTSLEEFESNSAIKGMALDDKIIRATFENEEGKTGEGLFMASLVSNGNYYVGNVDTLYNVAYNVIFISSAENEFINYESILSESLSTFKYKDSFVNRTVANIQETTDQTIKANATIQSAYDSYNSAWNTRQTTYDITSQKYSDATLGYERVYDTETGEVYKAYNGFNDDYTGSRYETISDDMYTEVVSGYIEKID